MNLKLQQLGRYNCEVTWTDERNLRIVTASTVN